MDGISVGQSSESIMSWIGIGITVIGLVAWGLYTWFNGGEDA